MLRRPGSMSRRTIGALFVAGATIVALTGSARADGLSTLMAGNTSTCVLGDTASPADCAATFAGQQDTAAGITTPVFDPAGGNVSTQNIHSLLYPGSTTKVYVNVMPGFCTPADGSSSASVPRCNSNVLTQYTENNTLTVDKQLADMARRGIDGASIDWYGPSSGAENPDAVALKFQSEIAGQGLCTGGAQACKVMYMIMFDGASLKYPDNATHVTGSSNAACATGLAASAADSCLVARFKNDICYMNGLHFGNNAYQKYDGRPVLQFFVDESEYGNLPKTGTGSSWTDVWTQVSAFSSDLADNCASPDNATSAHPYDVNNGAPLLLFENAGGFSQAGSGGAYGWVLPSGSQTDYEVTSTGTGRSIQEFYAAAAKNPSKLTWGIAYKGFNDSQSAWGAGRLIDQQCGRTWVTSMQEANAFYSSADQLPFLQIATWNDYNEGTSIEDGVNNCYTVSASAAGSTLNWTLNPTSSAASSTTVAGFQVYDSTDGGASYQAVGSLLPATARSFGMTGLPAGANDVVVKMVGQPEILNQASGAVAFTH